jgi:hypothetical protein
LYHSTFSGSCSLALTLCKEIGVLELEGSLSVLLSFEVSRECKGNVPYVDLLFVGHWERLCRLSIGELKFQYSTMISVKDQPIDMQY